jgi:PAS domain S-box-containing protein
VALTGDAESSSAFLVMDLDSPSVVSAAGPFPSHPGEPTDAWLAAQWEVPNPSELTLTIDGSGAAHSSTDPEHSVFAVLVADEVRGKLIVSRSGTEAQTLLPGLQLVCHQMGLALESADAVEERLQRSERKFSSLVQHFADSVTLLGPDCVILYQSASGRSVLGYKVGDLLGKTFVPLTHPDDAAYSRAQFIKVLHGGQGASVEFECRLRHTDGSWRQLETTLTNLLSDPDVGAVVSNSRDVTDSPRT